MRAGLRHEVSFHGAEASTHIGHVCIISLYNIYIYVCIYIYIYLIIAAT